MAAQRQSKRAFTCWGDVWAAVSLAPAPVPVNGEAADALLRAKAAPEPTLCYRAVWKRAVTPREPALPTSCSQCRPAVQLGAATQCWCFLLTTALRQKQLLSRAQVPRLQMPHKGPRGFSVLRLLSFPPHPAAGSFTKCTRAKRGLVPAEKRQQV